MGVEPITASLFPDTAQLSEDGVSVGGVDLRDLATTFGTPLFVYDEATLRERCREAARVFDDGVALRVQLSLAMMRAQKESLDKSPKIGFAFAVADSCRFCLRSRRLVPS